MAETRIETDSLGSIDIPADRYWGRRPNAPGGCSASARSISRPG